MTELESSNRRAELVLPSSGQAISSARGVELTLLRWGVLSLLSASAVILGVVQLLGSQAEARGLSSLSFAHWGADKGVLAAREAVTGSVNQFSDAQRQVGQKLVDCVGSGFGATMCGGPTGHDHGWMRHEEHCVDASEHNWDYVAGIKLLDNGVELGFLKDPKTGLCLGTHPDPMLGQLSLQACNKEDVDQLWHVQTHRNGVIGTITDGNEVSVYYNANDGSALDTNCAGKCFRHNVCHKTERYKAEVYDADQLPDNLSPKFKIPEDPTAPI